MRVGISDASFAWISPSLGLLSARDSGAGSLAGSLSPGGQAPRPGPRLALIDARRLLQVRPDGDIRHITAPPPLATSQGHDDGPTRTPRVPCTPFTFDDTLVAVASTFLLFLFISWIPRHAGWTRLSFVAWAGLAMDLHYMTARISRRMDSGWIMRVMIGLRTCLVGGTGLRLGLMVDG